MKVKIIFLIVIGVCWFHQAIAHTIRVPTDFKILQEAVDFADDGDTILIENGTYLGFVTTLRVEIRNKNLVIEGKEPNKSAILGFNDVPGATIKIHGDKGERVVFKNLRIAATVKLAAYIPEIIVTGNVHVIFENVVFPYAIRLSLRQGAKVEMKNVTVNKSFSQSYIHHATTGIYAKDFGTLAIYNSSIKTEKLLCEKGTLHLENVTFQFSDAFSCELSDINFSKSKIMVEDPSLRGISIDFIKCENVDIKNVEFNVPLYIQECQFLFETTKFVNPNYYKGGRKLCIAGSTGKFIDCLIENFWVGVDIESSNITLYGCSITKNDIGVLLNNGYVKINNSNIYENGSGIELEKQAFGVIVNSHINNNENWGIIARESAVAIGWGNTVTGNQRDLYGVSEWLIKEKPEESLERVVVPDQISTLTEAILRVKEGGEVYVRSGTYSEKCAIYKSLKIVGEGNFPTFTKTVGIFPSAQNVEIQNIKFAGVEEELPTGIACNGCSSLLVRNVIFENVRLGIVCTRCTGLVQNCSFLEGYQGVVWEGGTLNMEDCIFTNIFYSVKANMAKLKITDTKFTHGVDEGSPTGIGISVSQSTSRFSHCYVTGFETGIEIYGSKGDIMDCVIRNNSVGVVAGGADVTIISSDFSNNSTGLSIDGGTIVMKSCEITANYYGIYINPVNKPKKILGESLLIYNNDIDLCPSPEEFPWPAAFTGEQEASQARPGYISGQIITLGGVDIVTVEIKGTVEKTIQAENCIGSNNKCFHEILPPGVYTLKISAEGYEQKVLENVVVESDKTVSITIVLLPKFKW